MKRKRKKAVLQEGVKKRDKERGRRTQNEKNRTKCIPKLCAGGSEEKKSEGGRGKHA